MLLWGGASLSGEDYSIGVIGPFGGLNNTDNSLIIPANKAQDLLNVEITPGGKSVKKRKGYGLSTTLTYSTSPVHGVYNFFDASGNSVDLYFNDRTLTSSVNGGSATVIFSTGTFGATYQCVDSAGFAYCASSSRDRIIKTNGVTATQILEPSTGTMVAVTQERLVHAGFAEAPNRIDFSKANDFTTWTVGPADTDPTQYTITSPGSRITHITYACGRTIWFKDSSFGYVLQGDTLGDWQIRTISPEIGTFDNTDIYREGVLYFRGQDGHIYAYDCSNYQKMTRDLQTTISQSQARTVNSWTQTALADWQSGGVKPSSANVTLDASITTKGWSQTVTSSTDWGGGTFDSTVFVDTETTAGTLQMVLPDLFQSVFRDGTAGTKPVWSTFTGSTQTATYSIGPNGLQARITATATSTVIASDLMLQKPIPIATSAAGTTFFFYISSISAQTNASLTFKLSTAPFVSSTIKGNGATTGIGEFVGIVFDSQAGTTQLNGNTFSIGTTTVAGLWTLQSYPNLVTVWLGPNSYVITIGTASISGNAVISTRTAYVSLYYAITSAIVTIKTIGYDLNKFGVVPASFTFTSTAYDTAMSSPTWGNFSANKGTAIDITYQTQVSDDNVSYDSAVTATVGSPIASAQKRYIQSKDFFNFTPPNLQASSPVLLTDLTMFAYSTATFYSQVRNAPSITAWDTFSADKTDNSGSNTFFIRSSLNPITVFSSTPAWTSLTAGAIPTVATGTYFQIRDDIVGASSSTFTSLQDFTVGWFEGSALDKAYATYFHDALWWAVASGTGSTTNNRILRYDFLNSDWTIYDLAANGLLVRNQGLYFGSTTAGKIFKFGDADSDAGSAINAYWKSKDFFGNSPFVDKEIVNVSISAGSVQNSSMTVTYALNGSSATAYTVNLYDPNRNIVRSNHNLPQGKIGNTFNVKFGNNAADQPFETFAVQYGVREKPWIPSP